MVSRFGTWWLLTLNEASPFLGVLLFKSDVFVSEFLVLDAGLIETCFQL